MNEGSRARASRGLVRGGASKRQTGVTDSLCGAAERARGRGARREDIQRNSDECRCARVRPLSPPPARIWLFNPVRIPRA
eukprot:scaffold8599_cov110-Isochrysis_galbana.AAC.11